MKTQDLALILAYGYRLLIVAVCGLAIWLGYKLFILGVTGEASLSVKTELVQYQLLNAAPGLFFAVGGLIALILEIRNYFSIKFD